MKRSTDVSGLLVGVVASCMLFVSSPPLPAAPPPPAPRTVRIVSQGVPVPFAELIGSEWIARADRRGEAPWPDDEGALVRAEGHAEMQLAPGMTRVDLPREAIVAGTVRRSDGAPLGGATIEVVSAIEGAPPQNAVSDDEGRFEIGRLPPGPVRFSITAPGFARVSFGGTAPQGDVPVVMVPAAVLAGVVRDARGSPVLAQVRIGGGGLWPARTFTSDGEGRYRISDVPPGTYRVWAEQGDQRSAAVEVVLSEEARFLPLFLAEGLMLRGSVVDAAGAPFPGARVTVLDGSLEAGPTETRTNAEGEFSLGPFEPSPFARTILADAPGYLSAEATAGRDELTLVLRRGAAVSGTVRDARGRALAGVDIQWLAVGAAAPRPDSDNLGVTVGPIPPIPAPGAPVPASALGGAKTDQNGHFRLSGLQPGSGTVRATLGAYVPAQLDATAGADEEITLILREGATLSGRVVDGRGYAIEGATVDVVQANDDFPRTVLVDADGAFNFAGLIGTVTVTARPVAGAAAIETLVLVPGQARYLQLVLEAGTSTFEGRLVDARGFGVAAAELLIESATGRRPFSMRATSEADGTFLLRDVPPPPYRVVVDHAPFARAETTHASAAPLQLVLQLGARAVGTVRDDFRAVPLAGAQVSVIESDGEELQRITSDDEGRFAFDRLAVGNYRIVAESGGQRLERSLTVAGPDPLALAPFSFGAAGAVAFTVVDSLGDPASDALIEIEGETLTSDRRGNARRSGLSPGLYEVRVRHPEAGNAQSRRVRVVQGEAADARFVLPGRIAPGRQRAAERSNAITREGVAIRVERSGAAVRIAEVVAGSRAARAGLRVGDELVRLDGEAVLSAGTARSVLRGEGGRVRIEVRRGSRTIRRTVIRETHTLGGG
ncbi:MAG: carboxypeptidase regulatory-like domain-containing protein [Myxococcota bacterium]